MQKITNILDHLEYIHEWSSAEKARLIALVTLSLHLLVVITSAYLLADIPGSLNLDRHIVSWAFKLGSINLGITFLVLLYSHIVFLREPKSDFVIYLGVVTMAATLAVNASFMGIFDGYTWLLIYVLFALGSMILPQRIVYAVAASNLILLATMSFFPSLFPFPIRPYSLSNISDIVDMSFLDISLSWMLLLGITLSAFWTNSFLLKAARVREDDLKSKSSVDQLTSILNRRGVMERLSEEFSRARRAQYQLSLAMIDLDYFKNINDTYGHQLGDNALIHVAKHLQDIVRKTDLVSRFGGEEFLVVFPDCNMEDAEKVLTRLMANIKADPVFSEEGVDIKLTFSAGVTTLRDTDVPIKLEDIIARADAALYVAKKEGRDRVIIDK